MTKEFQIYHKDCSSQSLICVHGIFIIFDEKMDLFYVIDENNNLVAFIPKDKVILIQDNPEKFKAPKRD